MTFEEARACVIAQVAALRPPITPVSVPLEEALGRVLAEDARADRDYPPLPRSIRDGFAVRAADLPGTVDVIGEVRAGEWFSGTVAAGQAVEIMTGAPMPAGADAVVMVEHATRDQNRMTTERSPKPGEFVNPQGSETRQNATVVPAGTRLDYAAVAQLATIGIARVKVYPKPRVAILATGDELMEIAAQPSPWQIRNSNSYSIAAQVIRAGGEANIFPVARDTMEDTREKIALGLDHDLLLLSGGVSAGKYDVVERVLAEFGAEFYFDRVKIQPGQPAVFGRARDRFFFGLPGNPASTMITFELFARPALDLMGGANAQPLLMFEAPLRMPFKHKAGLTRFLPALLGADGLLDAIAWAGSSDVTSMTRANCYLLADSNREIYEAGDRIKVIPK